MFKSYRFMLLLVIVCLVGGSAAYAGNPTVSLLSFDPNTFTYVYRVIQGLDASDTLSDFNVDAFTNASDLWTMTSTPTANHFATSRTTWNNPATGQHGIEYQWYNGFVKPGAGLTAPWVGEFTLTVPNTKPVPGIAITFGSKHILVTHQVNVPGPVPEPSSCIALGAMLVGMCPAILRLRRR